MPRIRKKTSNRGTTNDRKKIEHKVRESRKKKAKAAKKNPEWKSKHKKDPGIPNDFPYKDQILAEVAEQRRIAAEEKQKKRAEKIANRAKGSGAAVIEEDPADVMLTEQEFDGVASIHAKRLATAKATKREAPVAVVEEEEEEDEAPLLVNRDLPHLKSVLDEADVVLEVLDARDPQAFRSSHVETLVKEKKGREMVFVLSKIDVCPQESVSAWTSVLRQQQPTFLFRSATSFLPTDVPHPGQQLKGKAKDKAPTDDALGVGSILQYLGELASKKAGDEPLRVAVVGFTNVGKSSLVNSLSKRAVLPIYSLASSSRGPTTTTLPHDMTIEVSGSAIRFIDTPGLMWEADSEDEKAEEHRSRDILMRNKGRIDRLKDPTLPIQHIVAQANNEDLMLLYRLPAFSKGNVDAFLAGVARSQQLVKKRGTLDLAGACRIVLRSWSTGKIRWYSHPPSSAPAENEADKDILATLSTRKELRKLGGLVRFSPGEVDDRKVMLEDPYETLVESSDEGEEGEGLADDVDETASMDEDEDEGEGEQDEQDEDEEDEDEGEEEPESLPSVKGKRKRGNAAVSAPANKRVTFESPPKSKSKPKGKPEPVPKAKPQTAAAAQKATKKLQPGEEAYDFGKFF